MRIAPHPEGARILLRDVHYRLDALLHSARKVEPSFWELFEAAPIPLAIEFATNEQIEGSTRLNRQFIQTFGYTEREVPTVQHWWSLAYRDEDYREQTRREWFARVQKAMAGGRPIEPIAATVVCKDGTERDILFGAARVGEHYVVTFIDLTQEKQIERKLARKVEELARALSNVRELSGLLPLCAWCHKLRDDEGYWRNVEEFLTRHTEVTHSICPDCRKSSFG